MVGIHFYREGVGLCLVVHMYMSVIMAKTYAPENNISFDQERYYIDTTFMNASEITILSDFNGDPILPGTPCATFDPICTHTYDKYVGLIQSYHYCTKCDIKKSIHV